MIPPLGSDQIYPTKPVRFMGASLSSGRGRTPVRDLLLTLVRVGAPGLSRFGSVKVHHEQVRATRNDGVGSWTVLHEGEWG